ncbi:MAG: SRPBCC family protein [Erythrobacter sp.]|uniref:SRPBCC family protein n=1 Tax=Erythrobacter sp. TaxID=1042 RepID=UPI0026323E21|nr:SRPBCC family protein [Erythrobacter sp.]MDJ0978560.1 SRPBCC family protein [Erythrobacter sp.]
MIETFAETSPSRRQAVPNNPALRPGIDIAEFTSAPLRFHGVYEFDVPPGELWPMVTNASNIAKWFPNIRGGHHSQTPDGAVASCDVGSKRMCQTIGMGTLDEAFLHSDPPRLSVYTIKNAMMPIENHVAIMHLVETFPGKTQLTWSHYLDYKGIALRRIFPVMMKIFMDFGIKKLASTVGGRRRRNANVLKPTCHNPKRL